MSYPNLVRVIRYETPDLNPFAMCPVRELARRTGLDASNLSKVKLGKIAITKERLMLLLDAADEWNVENQPKQYTSAEVEANESIGWYVDGDEVKQVVTISPREVRTVGKLAQPKQEGGSKL